MPGLLPYLRGVYGDVSTDAGDHLPGEPEMPWETLPEPRLLLFCCLDLMHYLLLTGGALDHAHGYSRRKRLYATCPKNSAPS